MVLTVTTLHPHKEEKQTMAKIRGFKSKSYKLKKPKLSQPKKVGGLKMAKRGYGGNPRPFGGKK